MKNYVEPSTISGTVKAPGSKSMTQRAIAASMLSETPTKLLNAGLCDDSRAAIRIIKTLSSHVYINEGSVFIIPPLKSKVDKSFSGIQGAVLQKSPLECGESGLSLRMFAPIVALWGERIMLTGVGSLLSRPVGMIEGPLKALWVDVTTSNGYPPLTVKGPLRGGEITVDGSISSQFLTGLLMALPKAFGNSQINVMNLKSAPYIDMTLEILNAFGIEIGRRGYEEFMIKGGQVYCRETGEYHIEGDWSGAAFLLVAGAIGGSVTVTGLNPKSNQPDMRIIDVLKAVGAGVRVTLNSVEITKDRLDSFSFNAEQSPDLFPPLAVLALNCRGTSKIEGVERLSYKESNRAEALRDLITSLGGNIRINDNIMEIEGTALKGGEVDSHNDHRIVMATAIAAINAEGGIMIRDTQSVDKSYPDFFKDLRKIGGKVNE